jgi:UTP-glucose-1-phosphate uridylyltransferase
MPNFDTPVSSLPAHPLEMEQELTQLEESGRFDAIIHAEKTVEVDEPSVYVYDLILITEETVSAVVYSENEKTWYRIFKEDRSSAELTDAYDAVRDVRNERALYDRHALTIDEAVFREDTPSAASALNC